MAKILVIDDDQDVVEATRIILEKEGHKVDSAFDRVRAGELVAAGKYDLLVLDVMMEEPDDGIVFAQELKKSGFASPILMMSSINTVSGMRYGEDAEVNPVDAFIEKPVKPSVLIGKVKELLRR